MTLWSHQCRRHTDGAATANWGDALTRTIDYNVHHLMCSLKFTYNQKP